MITAHQRSPAEAGAPAVDGAPPLEPVPDLPDDDRAPFIIDGGEPLVAVDDRLRCLNLYAEDGWPGTVERTWLRAGVVERLEFAQSLLPDGFALALFDGWRSLTTQRALYDRFYGPGSTLPPGFVADPGDTVVPPPHCTGAAVDLTLAWRGQALALGTPFDDFTPRAATLALEGRPPTGDRPGRGTSEPDRSLRRLLHAVLRAAGFAGLASEWWHVSFGDQQWAWQHRQAHARYGPVAPS